MKPVSQLSADFLRMGRQVIAKITEILPDVISVEGLRHFEESWDNQGFTDKKLVKWAKRKPPEHKRNKDGKVSKSFKSWSNKDHGRAVLVSHQTDKKGAHLKDTLRTTKNKKQVAFTTNKAYAEVHNEGGQAGRGTGFEMPQRQFMGPSEELNKKVALKLDREITKFLNSLK